MNMIEDPDFRDILLYLDHDLTDDQIPHRTKITEYIFSLFRERYTEMMREMEVCSVFSKGCDSWKLKRIQEAPERISYTTDVLLPRRRGGR